MSFPEQTTLTQNTATLTCEITGKTDGKVAAFYNDDIRTPSGGNSIGFNPAIQKNVTNCNISFKSTESSELTFTIKWMDTSTGDIYVCTPDHAITAGDTDGAFPGAPIVFTASSTPEGGGDPTSFPEQTTLTQNTATLTCEITGKTDGKVAAFYNDDIRTPSGGNSIGFNPAIQKNVTNCNISFKSTESSELTFTIKWMDTSTGDIYVCTPDHAITAGDTDGAFPGAPIVFTASSTPEGGGTTPTALEVIGSFSDIASLTQGTNTTTTKALTEVFSGATSYTYEAHSWLTGSGVWTQAVSGETSGDGDFVKVSASPSAPPGSYIVTVTAKNDDGEEVTATIAVTVIPPPPTAGSFNPITLTQGTSATTTETLASVFTGYGITYTYSETGTGVTAATSGDGEKVEVTATPGAATTDYTVTVTGTNDGGNVTATIVVTVVESNSPPSSAGEFENITVGKSTRTGTILVENFKNKFTDVDSDDLDYTFSSSDTNVCTVSEDGENIKLDFLANPDVGLVTITVIATDTLGSNTAFPKTFTVNIVVPKKVYVWTVSEIKESNMTTVIKISLTDANISVPGVHLKYNLTDVDNYSNKPADTQEYQLAANNPWALDSAVSTIKSNWTKRYINTIVSGKEYIVLFDASSKKLSLGSYDLMYFADVKFDVTIVGISDQYGNLIAVGDISNTPPPVIFEDTTVDPITGVKYGDVNVDGVVNVDDLNLLRYYLVGNNESYTETLSQQPVQAITKIETEIAEFTASGNYVSLGFGLGGVAASTGKAFSHIDVSKDGKIQVGDLCRLAEFLEDSAYNIIGNTGS